MPKSYGDIVREYTLAKMIPDPSFYAGRGNNSGDLNADILEAIYGGVEKEIGQNAARSFVEMVDAMTVDASASTFILSLARLEQQNWKFSDTVIRKPASTLIDSIGDATKDKKSMESVVFAASAGPRHGEPVSRVTGDFLKNHAGELGYAIAPQNGPQPSL